MHCPRRSEASGLFRFPTDDEWYDRDGVRCCSYCGSQHPDDFMAHVEAGGALDPTDKNYKVYVLGGPFTKFYFPHLSEEQRRRFVELMNAGVITTRFYVAPFFVSRSGQAVH